MSRRYGRLVDGIWIRQRMNAKDARRERELRERRAAAVSETSQTTVVVEVALVPALAQPVAHIVEITLERTRSDGER